MILFIYFFVNFFVYSYRIIFYFIFSIKLIEKNAISLTAVNVLIENNTMNFLERYWFGVKDYQDITVRDNHFGEYHQISAKRTKVQSTCLFINNFLTKANSDSLNFENPLCQIRQISFNEMCSCDTNYYKKLSNNDIRKESFCRIGDALAGCFNATLYNVEAYEHDLCDKTKNGIECNKRINTKTHSFFIDLDTFRRNEKLFYIYIAAAIILIAMLCCLSCILCKKCTRNRKQMEENPVLDVMLTENMYQPQRRSSTPFTNAFTTLDDARRHYDRDVFSASDMLVIRQTLQLMKKKYPPEIYDQVHNNTAKLIGGDLTETEKVFTIDEIVRSLLECENTGTDFIAFTGILYKHLGTPDANAPPPAYMEVNPLADDDDEDIPLNIPNTGNIGEHIYAEPVQLQQPLLRPEYTVPIDQNDNVSHLYTEPIARAIGEDLFCHKCSTLMNSFDRKRTAELLANEICICQAKLDDLYSNFIYSK